MENKFVLSVIGVVVGIIILGSVLAPVLSDAMETERTFHNSGFADMEEIGDTTHVITWDISTGTIDIDGESMQLSKTVLSSMYPSIILTDKFCFRIGYASNAFFTHATNNGQLLTLSDSSNVFTCTIDTTKIVVTRGSATQTIPLSGSTGYVISMDALHTMKSTNTAVYVNSDTEIFATGISSVGGVWYRTIHIQGTLDDLDVTVLGTDATATNIQVNMVPVSGYDDLYLLSSVEMDIVSGSSTDHVRYTYFVVPSEVTAEKTDHLNPGSIMILGAIIPIVIIGIILGAGIIRREY